MKRFMVPLAVLALTVSAFAGFKVKLIKPKKAEQFQARAAAGGVTFAADLLLDGKDQKDFFYKELTPAHVIALRLAVFNSGSGEVVLPLDGVRLVAPDGAEVPMIGPDTVAKAVLNGLVVGTAQKPGKVGVGPNVRAADPRDPRYDPTRDPRDPRYDPNDPRAASDPRLDPNYPPGRDPRLDPSRDPRYDPNDPRTAGDPRYDPNYPRNRRYGGYGGVDVVLNPGGGAGSGDLSQFEKGLVEKDFSDKAHSPEPVLPSLGRDRFLYFSIESAPAAGRGFTLRIPRGKGIAEEIVLKF